MSLFQLLMLAAAAFFAYQIYRHVQTLEEPVSPGQPVLKDSTALLAEADAAYERGALVLAREKLENAIEIDPENTDVLNKLGYVQAKQGENERAIESYLTSLKIDPANDLVHNAIAMIYRTQGDFKSAQEHYESALSIDDAYPPTYYHYANLLTDRGYEEKARSLYEKALELDPDFIDAHEALEKLKGSDAQ